MIHPKIFAVIGLFALVPIDARATEARPIASVKWVTISCAGTLTVESGLKILRVTRGE